MDVVVLNDVAYVADRTDLTVIDVANPASPTLLGAMPGAGRALAVQDQIAYVLADFQLQIVDVFF